MFEPCSLPEGLEDERDAGRKPDVSIDTGIPGVGIAGRLHLYYYGDMTYVTGSGCIGEGWQEHLCLPGRVSPEVVRDQYVAECTDYSNFD